MTMSIKIQSEVKTNKQILRVEGRLDASSAPILEVRLNELIDAKHTQILIDFSKLDYLSSAGMRLLLSMTKKLKSIEGSLKFCGINEEVMEIIKMAGFERILEIYLTEKEALESFNP